MARRNLARTNSVAQSDLGVRHNRDTWGTESELSSVSTATAGGYRHDREMIRAPAANNPVTVKTIELRERQTKNKIKIRQV